MPIPAQAHPNPTVTDTVVVLFHQLHDELRKLVGESDYASLNFVPCPDANSIATIITHLVGSEAETLQSVAGIESVRDRDAEFRRGEQTASGLLAQLDAADALLDELASALTADRLERELALPTLPSAVTRRGITWLIGNLGHAREHVGHARLTKQLYDSQLERS